VALPQMVLLSPLRVLSILGNVKIFIDSVVNLYSIGK
jgi:hypothetical protein